MSEATGEYLRPVTDGDWQALIDMKDSILRLAHAENDQLRAELAEKKAEFIRMENAWRRNLDEYRYEGGQGKEIKQLRSVLGWAYPIMFDLCGGEVLDEKLARRVDDFYRAVDALEGGDD